MRFRGRYLDVARRVLVMTLESCSAGVPATRGLRWRPRRRGNELRPAFVRGDLGGAPPSASSCRGRCARFRADVHVRFASVEFSLAMSLRPLCVSTSLSLSYAFARSASARRPAMACRAEAREAGEGWSRCPESNRRPYQGRALPTSRHFSRQCR